MDASHRRWMNISITFEVTSYPRRRPPLVIEGSPAIDAVDNSAAAGES
jgi:hypothetical protein